MIARPRGRTLLLGTVVAAVLAVVGVAVAVLDSPAEERRRRLDERRIDDLHEIADAIDDYWTEGGALPPDLDALAEWRRVDLPLADPVTGTRYRYTPTGEQAYELCATFATESPSRSAPIGRYHHGRAWHHPAGDHCFRLGVEVSG